jgi:pimeloyl-ACP methyl ester carboxylesterase
VSWVLNISALSQKYHVIALDQIGFGKSDKPMLKYRVGTYTDFLDKFLSEIKIEKATLIGNSLGGWVAADFALKYPNKVEKIVLADAAGIKPSNVNLNQIYALNYSTREEVRTLVKLVFYNQTIFGSDAFIEESMRVRVAAGDGYTINSLIDSIKRDEDFLNGRLGGIKQPTLIIWGKQDGILPLADGEKFDKEIPNSTLVVFDGCGHVPQIEKALDFNGAVLKFLGN